MFICTNVFSFYLWTELGQLFPSVPSLYAMLAMLYANHILTVASYLAHRECYRSSHQTLGKKAHKRISQNFKLFL